MLSNTQREVTYDLLPFNARWRVNFYKEPANNVNITSVRESGEEHTTNEIQSEVSFYSYQLKRFCRLKIQMFLQDRADVKVPASSQKLHKVQVVKRGRLNGSREAQVLQTKQVSFSK